MEEKTNTKKWIIKNTCRVVILEASKANQDKWICKASCTLIQKVYGIWWYEQKRGKLKWIASMMLLDIVHAHAEVGGEPGKIGTNDYLWTVHGSWCYAKAPPILNKWLWQGEKRVDGPKKDERTGQSKLSRMGMMGRWMEIGTQVGIGVS